MGSELPLAPSQRGELNKSMRIVQQTQGGAQGGPSEQPAMPLHSYPAGFYVQGLGDGMKMNNPQVSQSNPGGGSVLRFPSSNPGAQQMEFRHVPISSGYPNTDLTQIPVGQPGLGGSYIIDSNGNVCQELPIQHMAIYRHNYQPIELGGTGQQQQQQQQREPSKQQVEASGPQLKAKDGSTSRRGDVNEPVSNKREAEGEAEDLQSLSLSKRRVLGKVDRAKLLAARRFRNRESASRSRMRVVNKVEELESVLKEMREENAKLRLLLQKHNPEVLHKFDEENKSEEQHNAPTETDAPS